MRYIARQIEHCFNLCPAFVLQVRRAAMYADKGMGDGTRSILRRTRHASSFLQKSQRCERRF